MKIQIFTLTIILLLFGASQQSPFEILAEVQDTSFGQALASFVELNTSKSGRLDAIYDLLMEIQGTLKKEIEETEAELEKCKTSCATQIASIQKSLDDNKTTLTNQQNEQKSLIEEQGDKTKDLASQKTELEKTVESLKKANEDKETELKEYSEQSASYEEAIKACEEAIKLLQGLLVKSDRENSEQKSAKVIQTQTMFVQLSKKFDSVKDIMEKHVKKAPNAFIQPIIDVLAELGNSNMLNYEKLQDIITLIQNLLKRLREGKTERDESHTQIIKDLDKLTKTQSKAQGEYETKIKELEDRLKAIDQRLKELEKLIAQYEKLVASYEKLLADKKDDCEKNEKQITSDLASYKGQNVVLEKLIKYFHDKVVGSTEDVGDEVYEDKLKAID